MGRKKLDARSASVPSRTPKNIAQRDLSVSYGRARFDSVPRQRGRPPKAPLENSATVAERGGESEILKKALKPLKNDGRSILTQQNGFSRNIKATAILGAFLQDDELIFCVMFKSRKLPQIVQASEVQMREPSLFLQYFVENIGFDPL